VVCVGGVIADPLWIALNSMTAQSSTPIPKESFLLDLIKRHVKE
jgi:hypothetical protein